MTQISSSAFSTNSPMCFARGPNGDLYGVNGQERGLRWDGVSANVEQLGITAPAAAPTVAANTTSPLFTVTGIDVIAGGKGFTRIPAVTVGAATSGAAAKATAAISGSSVSRITITDFGGGYSAPPAVTIAAPTGSVAGSGATLTPVMGSLITGALITNLGSGYTEPPVVTVADEIGGPGAGAILEATVIAGRVRGIVVINPGTTAYTAPTISFSGGGGSGAAATLRTQRGVQSVTVTAGGSGYFGEFDVQFYASPFRGTGAVAIATGNTSGAIASVTVLAPGSYSTNPLTTVATPRRLATTPAQAVAVLSRGTEGRFLCAYRYVDDTPRSSAGPIPSSLSPFATLEISSPAAHIAWSALAAGPEARASRIELWRTTADQALSFFRVAVLPIDTATFTDVLRDEELTAGVRARPCTAVAATDVITCTGHGLAEGDAVAFSSLAGGAGVVANKNYYARDVTGTTFKVAETAGGSAVDITTDLTAGTALCQSFGALPIVLPDGAPNAYRFRPPPANKSTMVIYQDRAWYAVDSPGIGYDGVAVANAAEPNTLYFSETDEPESVPETNQIILQDNVNGSDRITGLMPFGGGMVVFQERNCYRLSYATEPLLDGSLSLIAQRGCLHQRAYDVAEGVAYVADYSGIYTLSGADASPLSEAIDDFWTEGRIKFSAMSQAFMRADPRTHIVRFFFADATQTTGDMPDRALCYHPLTKAWWLEVYGQAITAATAGKIGGQLSLFAGGAGGAVMKFDATGEDLLANGTTSGIACSFRTGSMALNSSKDRSIRLLYRPTTAAATLTLRLHYNNSDTARPSAVASDPGNGFKAEGGQGATLDLRTNRSALGAASGNAVCRYSGRVDDRSSGADRHIAVDFSLVRPSSEAVTLYGAGITGAGG